MSPISARTEIAQLDDGSDAESHTGGGHIQTTNVTHMSAATRRIRTSLDAHHYLYSLFNKPWRGWRRVNGGSRRQGQLRDGGVRTYSPINSTNTRTRVQLAQPTI